MIRRPPRTTRTDTRCPDTTLFRSTSGDHPEGSHASGSGPGKLPMPYARVAWDHLGQMATPARPDIRRSLRLPTDLARSSDRRVVAGVCGGLGHSPGVDANVLRLAAIGRAHAELQSLMRISDAGFCLKKRNTLH